MGGGGKQPSLNMTKETRKGACVGKRQKGTNFSHRWAENVTISKLSKRGKGTHRKEKSKGIIKVAHEEPIELKVKGRERKITVQGGWWGPRLLQKKLTRPVAGGREAWGTKKKKTNELVH